MMRVLLCLCCIFLVMGDARAQRASHAPSLPAEKPARPDAPAKAPAPDLPAFQRVVGGCIAPMAPVVVEGNHLLRLTDAVFALRHQGNNHGMEAMQRTDTRAVLRLKQPGAVQGNLPYPLHVRVHGAWQDTGLTVTFCPTAGKNDAQARRNILILADRKDASVILNNLRDQQLQLVRDHDLPALGQHLFMVKASPEGDKLLSRLRRAFPEAQVDWNDDLSAAGLPRLYAKQMIGWPEDKACLSKASRLPIGMLDGEVAVDHPAFDGQKIHQRNFLEGAHADRQHATAIASLLVGSVPERYDGLLPGTPVYAAVVLRRADGQQLASLEAVAQGLNWLLHQNIRLMNVSLATSRRNRVLEQVFMRAAQKGALLFAAAGNEGPHAPPAYPAALEEVMAVTAVDAAGKPYAQANRGQYIDVAAPGVDVWVAEPEGGGAYRSGTSYAVPHALAGAALTLSENAKMPRDLLRSWLQSQTITPGSFLTLHADVCR